MPKRKKTSSDLQGISQLVTAGAIGIIDLVEALQQQIINPPFLPNTPTQKLLTKFTGFTYNTIRQGTRLAGYGTTVLLKQLEQVIGTSKTTNERAILRSVLNGIIGDYLEEKENALKIEMELRYDNKAINLNRKDLKNLLPDINGKILFMVHGSCMNDIQWTRNKHNHGNALAETFSKTPIFLNYNSGRHISTNGKELNELLEKLQLSWSVPIEEIVIIAHSMGGLVVRSAIYYGQQHQNTWIKQLKKVVFLGTPHHGAPLEKAGNFLDVILENIPYAKPFARLGKIRSAGVTDLRYGNLVDEDWKDKDRFKILGDQRQSIPLPKKVTFYSIAGIAGKKTKTATKLLGDKLVGVKSALGQHKNPKKNLIFKKKNTWIAEKTNHLDLLSSSKVYSKIERWIAE